MKQIIFYLSYLCFISVLNSIKLNENSDVKEFLIKNPIKDNFHISKKFVTNEDFLKNLASNMENSIKPNPKIFNSEITISFRKKEDITNKDIEIWVFYDALCGDSRFYFKNSFRELYNTIKDLNLNINLKLIPGALEKYDSSLSIENNDYNDFLCKHGEVECFANAIHACSFFFFDKNLSFKFVDCYFDNVREFGLDIKQTAEFCSKKINKDESYSDLLECASGISGKIHISNNIKLKDNVQGRINRSPSIVINRVFNYMKEDEIEADTVGYLCKNYKIDKLSESEICKAYKDKNYRNYFKKVNFLSKVKKGNGKIEK